MVQFPTNPLPCKHDRTESKRNGNKLVSILFGNRGCIALAGLYDNDMLHLLVSVVPFLMFDNPYSYMFDIITIICSRFFFYQRGSNMGPNRSGMLPAHSQTLLGHFWENTFFSEHIEKRWKSWSVDGSANLFFFLEIIKMKKTCIATTRILTVRWAPHLPYWSPFVKKTCFEQSV